ncbi:putative ATP-dependent DNA helicase II, 70 kDa subunit [Neospora caninum Liverpool]|uniref:ATP-dependent DNA helicase II, 70 kDa subunit,putative n=1 Tax=Neospora caninum (strain Liverpool) TaxID=572307 RepID=F0VQJ2_NEOCL|nr:putative ATP-dependent DNA helicase II, 70 kDa subunit [Neospora caninum Liverpool]CBZ55989.1 putative ATP-dependent DNA helicase II, 70 kDa subunit [Neospora caninum Liverpool]CEL70735.1 TPA: ATP-dependent DNA helicase II, 70 kDa subunit,putative [Neospora caninum Liverpool]|eukprot:XP_003886015.1 putative ATP-dependent DNA helicase II, 70 kDa subunit [Neospora caninum Liverpool]
MDFDATTAARFLFEEGSESEEEDFLSDFLRFDEHRLSASNASPGAAESLQESGALPEETPQRGRLLAPREEIVIWCVDCGSENLFRQSTSPGPDVGGDSSEEEAEGNHEAGTSPWTDIMTACTNFVKRKIVSGQRLIFGLFLSGTGASANDLAFPHISAALPAVDEVDVHTVQRLQALARLTKDEFVNQFGKPVANTPERPPLADVFWLVSHALNAAAAPRRRGSRHHLIQQRVVFFTDDDRPCAGYSREASAAARQRLRDLREDGVEFLLVPLDLPGKASFAMEAFWRDALLLADAPEDGREGEASKTQPSTVDSYKHYVRLRMAEIRDNIRLLDRSQRVLSVLPFHLRPSLQLPICLLSSVRAQALPKARVLTADARQEPLLPGRSVHLIPADLGPSGEKARTATATARKDRRRPSTDESEEREEEADAQGREDDRVKDEEDEGCLMRRLQLLGPDAIGYYTVSGGKKIGLDWKDIQTMKDFGSPGLSLLCCVSAASLAFEMNMGSPLFVTTAAAAERAAGAIDGAEARWEQEKLFSAFVMTLCKRELVAIARLVPKHGSPVALVALLPQLEEVDEAGNTLQAPGLHLLRLPFAEDIREIDLPWTSLVGFQRPGERGDARERAASKRECEMQIQAAVRVLSALGVEDFHPHQLSNDALQRHFAIIEALALGNSEADLPPPTLVPDSAILEKAGIKIREWKESVYGTADAAFVPPTPRWASTAAPRTSVKRNLPAGGAKQRDREVFPLRRAPGQGPGDEEGDASAVQPPTKRPRKGDGGGTRTGDRGTVGDDAFDKLYREDRISALTVPQLTAWIRRHGETPKARKADLVQQAETIWESEK